MTESGAEGGVVFVGEAAAKDLPHEANPRPDPLHVDFLYGGKIGRDARRQGLPKPGGCYGGRSIGDRGLAHRRYTHDSETTLESEQLSVMVMALPYLSFLAAASSMRLDALGLYHAVADARLGEDVPGAVGVVVQLPAKLLDEGAQEP